MKWTNWAQLVETSSPSELISKWSVWIEFISSYVDDPQDTKEEEEKIQTPQPVPPQTPVIDVNHPTPSSGYNQYLSSESFNLSTPTKMPSLSSPDGPATRSSSVQRKSRFDLSRSRTPFSYKAPSSKPDHFPYNNVSSTVSPVHPSAEPRSIPDVAAMTQPSERPPS